MIVTIFTGLIIIILICLYAYAIKTQGQLRSQLTEKSIELADTLRRAITAEAEIGRMETRYKIDIDNINRRHEAEIIAVEKRHEDAVKSIKDAQEQDRKRREEADELRFKSLATEILGNTQRVFKEQNESRMEEILKPMRENIDQFRRSIEEKYTKEAQERFSLKEKIDELKMLNDSISREARELSTALRGNSKIQGDWGEVILESILEKSGLEKGREFTVQESHDADGKPLRDENGRALRPDVVVHYPDSRCVVVDSKVSLTDYVKYCNCDTPEEREKAGKAHINSVRRHIAELAQKGYQDYVGVEKLDFVMMFIPHESAYIAAMQLEPALWQEAYDKRVLIISPTHLISVLKLISQLWNHDRQTRNAIDIATESGKLYDKFAGFIDDMLKIERSIAATSDAYSKAMNKLKTGNGNIFTRIDKLRKLGAKASKSISALPASDMGDTISEDSE